MELKNNKKKPCKECPFARNNTLSRTNPGGSKPEVYVGQSLGPFWLPCHMEKEYNGKETNPEAVNQCAGAAIYRSNVNAPKMPEQILRLPEDKETVFASHAEFLAHYKDLPIEQVQASLTNNALFSMLITELQDSQVKLLSKN